MFVEFPVIGATAALVQVLVPVMISAQSSYAPKEVSPCPKTPQSYPQQETYRWLRAQAKPASSRTCNKPLQ
ncbi:MAG: hypothetical protein AAGD25_29590 [Cyanobacteria bacterium P01_F01_bin.150]